MVNIHTEHQEGLPIRLYSSSISHLFELSGSVPNHCEYIFLRILSSSLEYRGESRESRDYLEGEFWVNQGQITWIAQSPVLCRLI